MDGAIQGSHGNTNIGQSSGKVRLTPTAPLPEGSQPTGDDGARYSLKQEAEADVSRDQRLEKDEGHDQSPEEPTVLHDQQGYVVNKQTVTSAPAPPRFLRAPGCPASRTPAIYYAHLPPLVTRVSDIELTHHLFITSPIFVSSIALLPAAALIVFCLCYLFADTVPVSFHVLSILNVYSPYLLRLSSVIHVTQTL